VRAGKVAIVVIEDPASSKAISATARAVSLLLSDIRSKRLPNRN
jgi:hypothetical protein